MRLEPPVWNRTIELAECEKWTTSHLPEPSGPAREP
jgi:hypothetical protein